MADLDTQIQQAAIYAQPPTLPLNVVNPPTATGTTQQLPGPDYAQGLHTAGSLQRQFPVVRPTYSNSSYVPNVAPGEKPPPPPKEKTKGEPETPETARERFDRNRLRLALAGVQLGQSTNRLLQGANRNLGSIPTPGTIWTPFWILVFLFLVLIPVNGHTRLNWFWLALVGSASVGVLNATPSVGSVVQGTPSPTNSVPILSPTPINQPTLPFIPLITSGSYIVGINSGLENV